jgi:universal stress protein A
MKQPSGAYRDILATVDFGEMTEAIVSRARDISSRSGAQLQLANVLEMMPAYLYHALPAAELEAIQQKSSAWSSLRLRELQQKYPDISVAHTISGSLAQEVQGLAERIGADLLVIGAHERRGMAILFRDRSDEVLHRAGRDVLLVKRHAAEAREPAPPYRGVLAAVCFDGSEVRVLERARRLAELYGANLILLHVIDHFPVDRSNRLIAPEDRDPLEFEREDAGHRLQELAHGTGCPGCRREVVVTTSTASRVVADFAEEQAVDIVVAGSQGRHALGGLLGSTAYGIVHRAPCDVLVVQRPARP